MGPMEIEVGHDIFITHVSTRKHHHIPAGVPQNYMLTIDTVSCCLQRVRLFGNPVNRIPIKPDLGFADSDLAKRLLNVFRRARPYTLDLPHAWQAIIEVNRNKIPSLRCDPTSEREDRDGGGCLPRKENHAHNF